MTEIHLLNIPNFFSSYYLYGLNEVYSLKYKPEKEFEQFNNQGYVIFKVGQKIGVIDNRDPVGVNEFLYEKADLYFATNKLLNNASYNQDKVRPLFPHYPINIVSLYLRLFRVKLFTKLKPRDFAREIYVLRNRPKYKLQGDKYKFSNYVFFAGSTWKKEPWANEIRAQFIQACKAHPKIKFEGGFIPRSDGDNFGYDKELNIRKYSPTEFSEFSANSLISLNNPAVLGAVSWRLADNWNNSSFVLSFPFAIDLPVSLTANEEICYIENSEQFEELLDKIITNPDYHKKIATGGKIYFDKFCTPQAQAKYVVENLTSSQSQMNIE